MKHELRALTSVRGVAAWWVVLYHIRLSIAGLPTPLLAVFAKGYLAVDFFFLLSGFVIWLSWGDRVRESGRAEVPRFLQKRIARIWPLHLVILAGAVALAVVLAATGRANPYAFPFAQLPLHIMLLQNWGFTEHLAWNDPAWSISCELAAYLLFPLLVAAIDWRRVPTGLLLVTIAGLFALLHGVMVTAGATTLGWDITHLGLVRCLFEFTAGTAICALWLRCRDRWQVPAALASAVAIALIAGWATGVVPETLAVPPAFAALLLTLALTTGRGGNPLDARPIHYLGEISYATYLAHFLLFVAFKLVLVDDPRAVPPALIALYLALVFASSVALYHLVERPAQRWVNRLSWKGITAASPLP